MATPPHAPQPGWAHRLHAVLALRGGEPRPQVAARLVWAAGASINGTTARSRPSRGIRMKLSIDNHRQRS